jgi:hypothetical protein
MPLAILTFLTGISISIVAIYYSVLGLAAIFAAAVIPIYVMGTILELSKLVTAWWLKANWNRAPVLLKSYMFIAVIALMLITSMGIFGFLSKAHSDQDLISGDVQAKLIVYDEKIKTSKENIESNRKALKQLDEAVDQIMSRSTSESGADKAVQIRRSQARDRTRLLAEIQAEQKTIAKLNEESAPIRAEIRKVEAEVGPLKYIAKLIYGDNTDANLLEKAVVWVIIIIVLVFDPLAVLLLLASQMSFQWARQDREKKNELVQETPSSEEPSEAITASHVEPSIGKDDGENTGKSPAVDENAEERPRLDPHPVGWMYSANSNLDNPIVSVSETKDQTTEIVVQEEPKILAIPEVERPGDYLVQVEETDDDILTKQSDNVKAAMSRWKSEHPDGSLKHQRLLLEKGVIDSLPWEDYLKPEVDEENQAAVEAAKWAQEQIEKSESSKKKDSDLDGKSGPSTGKTDQGRIEGYVQNEEQSNSTLWQRVKAKKDDR